MSIRRRVHQASLRTAAAVSGVFLGAAAAYADSGNGPDTSLGNALNPTGRAVNYKLDPDGLGQNVHSRTPTGFLNAEPKLLHEPRKTGGGWLYSGSIEVGGMATFGSDRAAKFREYKDLDTGGYLDNFNLSLERPGGGYYLDLMGGGADHDDQYYGAQFGRYNSWRVKGFYNETPHEFTSQYRNLWSGTGTNNLTLKTLRPGGTTNALITDNNIGLAALSTSFSSLSLVREKGGARLDWMITGAWKAFASFTTENRKGARPWGMVEGGGGGTGGVEIPESIDYDTHEATMGFNYAGELTSINLQVSASLFRNNIDTETVQNPMFVPAAAGIVVPGVASFTSGTFDLYPDNDFFNVKGEFARAFPEFYRSRLTAVVSASTSQQNDRLIPYTSYAGITVNGVAGGNWNTTSALSKQRADASIETRLVDVGWTMSPVNALDVKADVRYYETMNDSEYWACNPLTGQWGRLINNGSGSALVNTAAYLAPAVRCNRAAVRALNIVPSAGNINIGSVPYEYRQMNYQFNADYRLARAHSFNGSYERETFDRAHRERNETWEDRVKLGYVNRSFERGTLRMSIEHDWRRGSQYHSDPYEEFYSASLGPEPTLNGTNVTSWIHTNGLHRKFDLADRNQLLFNARFNYAITEAVDGAFSLQLKRARYPSSDYGRNGDQSLHSFNFDLNWQPMDKLSAYGFFSKQYGTLEQKGLQANACALGTTYYFYSDGSMTTTGLLTPAQLAAGITVVGNSGRVTAANFQELCGNASATSPLYPDSRAWTLQQKDHNHVLGAGLKYDFKYAQLTFDYTYSQSDTSTEYAYNAAALALATSGAPTAAQRKTLALIGNGFSDMTFNQHALDASLLVPVMKGTSIRLLMRYEVGDFQDWHYDGVANFPAPAINQQTYLDAGPQDYSAGVVGIMLRYEL